MSTKQLKRDILRFCQINRRFVSIDIIVKTAVGGSYTGAPWNIAEAIKSLVGNGCLEQSSINDETASFQIKEQHNVRITRKGTAYFEYLSFVPADWSVEMIDAINTANGGCIKATQVALIDEEEDKIIFEVSAPSMPPSSFELISVNKSMAHVHVCYNQKSQFDSNKVYAVPLLVVELNLPKGLKFEDIELSAEHGLCYVSAPLHPTK